MSDKLPMPGAQAWRAVAEVLTRGLAIPAPDRALAVFIGGERWASPSSVLKKVTRGTVPALGGGHRLWPSSSASRRA